MATASHAPASLLKRAFACAGMATLLITVATCNDGGPDGNGARTCGDGKCSAATCETPVRCSTDCGACQGADCASTGPRGSCGQPCNSSCDCVNVREVCTADYGFDDRRCVPVECFSCNDVAGCQLSPDSEGVCATVTCG